MNETDADISVSGKSAKMRQQASKYTKQRFPALPLPFRVTFFSGLFGNFPTFPPVRNRLFPLNNWICEYILHFSDIAKRSLPCHSNDRISVLCYFHSPDLYSIGEKSAYLFRPAGQKKFHPPHRLRLRIRFMSFYIRFRPCRCRFKMVRYAKSCGLPASHQV